MRNMVFPVLPQITSISINNGCGIVQDTRLLLFINRGDDHHLILLCIFSETLRCRARNRSADAYHFGVLTRTEIRRIEYLLHAKDLNTFLFRLLQSAEYALEHRFLDFLNGSFPSVFGRLIWISPERIILGMIYNLEI